MNIDNSIWGYFTHAGPVVKLVMLLLLVASVASWTLIIQRALLLRGLRHGMRSFEDKFWSGVDLNKLYNDLSHHRDHGFGLANIFIAGFKEFLRLHQQPHMNSEALIEASQRAMRIAQARESDKITQHLPMLATIGSTSPYIGLFGTVWGIMASFHALSNVQQASIALVAPGISEALVATAMGLFAAIPAVIGYNRFINDVDRIQNHYDTFQEEFSAVLYRLASKGAE